MATAFPTTGSQEGDILAGYIKNGTYSPNIPADTIKPSVPLTLPDAPNPTDYASILKGTTVSLPKSLEEQKLESDIATSRSDVITKTKELGTEGEFQAEKEKEFGVDTKRKDLSDLESQLMSVNNEATAATLSIDKPGDPTRLTVASNLDKQAIERDRTIKALRLSSSIQAIRGNLELANDQVSRAVDLKYNRVRTELEILNKQLEFNYKDMDKEEKKRADAQKQANDLKLKQLDLEIDAMKAWETTKNTALSNNAPLSVVRQAETLRDQGQEDAARAALAPYTGAVSKDTTGTGSTSDEIDEYAQGFISGEFTVTNIPANLRAKVRARAKEIEFSELKDLIDQNKNAGGYGTREELIAALAKDFPRLDKQQIIDEVYGRIGDVKNTEENGGGFIDSISNWLFNG